MADFKKCSPRLRNMVEVGKKNCPTNNPDSDKEAETAFFKTVLGLACQGVKTMEATLSSNGIDVSKPSELTETQWQVVCVTSLRSFPPDLLQECSGGTQLKKLVDAATTKCPNMGEPRKPDETFLDDKAKAQVENLQNAACEAVKTLEASAKARGADLSNPSKLTPVQWGAVCVKFQFVPKDARPSYPNTPLQMVSHLWGKVGI
jgi:hypothetical protein